MSNLAVQSLGDARRPLPTRARTSAEAELIEAPAAILDLAALDVAGPELGGVAVLIIEDEPLIALDLQYTIESLGHRVTSVARTRSEAVRSAREKPPRLIFADVRLADGSSGIQAVNEILEDCDADVVLMSGFPERMVSGPMSSACTRLEKPVSERRVAATIERLLSGSAPSRVVR